MFFIIQFCQAQSKNKMTECHQSCLTCTDQNFNSCQSCVTTLYALTQNTCACLNPWQEQCVGQQANNRIRAMVYFMTMLIQLFLVGIAFLYLLRVRMPISYRIWNALAGLSLLVYNEAFYLDYEDQFMLKELFGPTNGPYFATYRINSISTIYILPTIFMAALIVGLFPLLYIPITLFDPKPQEKPDAKIRIKSRKHNRYNSEEEISDNQKSPFYQSNNFKSDKDLNPLKETSTSFFASYCWYIKQNWSRFFDSFVFLACRLMFYFIGLTISQAGKKDILFIIICSVYGAVILANWARMINKYHQDSLDELIYDSPMYLYTMLSPASLIGLPMCKSKILLVVVFCSPIALLFLILLFNRNMKIFTRPKIKIYLTQIVSIGLIVAYILINDPFRTYFLLGTIMLSALIFIIEGIYVMHFLAFDLTVKVHPEPQIQKNLKRINKEVVEQKASRNGYF